MQSCRLEVMRDKLALKVRRMDEFEIYLSWKSIRFGGEIDVEKRKGKTDI